MRFDLTTFGFELVNFLVLLLLLERLVYRPLRRGVAARRAALEAREAGAKQVAADAERLKAELEERARSIDELRAQALREASVAAADERARILEQAREDAAGDRARAQHLLEAEREASQAEVRELAVRQATALAGRLLTQLAPDALETTLLDALLAELATRGETWKGEPDYSKEEEVEVTWARQPADAVVRRLRDALAGALQPGLTLVHREDASLGSGAVLRFGHHVLDASTAGQLAAVRGRARALLDEASGRG